ncbi:primosomal protein N' [Phytoactinopolyspora limicola]|uniref:primosomal protein N' n=1 Tax=Phytoactinopolyspora limicola TaxID=2715536 RepID=UPI001A9C7D96|nr:primosomal protein N' [Phytoactinopolyspora limicola]
MSDDGDTGRRADGGRPKGADRDGAHSGQLALAGTPRPKRRPVRPAQPVASHRPVARVLVDIGLAHLDRPFDYAVPESMADDAVPGSRVRVRFAGTDHDGFILDRSDSSDHSGRLSPLRRVVSPEPVLTAHVASLARMVADRWAGTVADVLRLAIPPRHATTEKRPSPPAEPAPTRPEPGAWVEHNAGPAFLDALARPASAPPRAVLTPAPGADWADLLARAVGTTLSAGRGALVVVPDARDVARLDAALTEQLGAGHHAVLGAEPGPAERYRRWLGVLRGSTPAAIGTRSAMFAPVANLGLVAIWDDGDDLHAEPRAPYPHAREVLVLRAHLGGAAVLLGGHMRTAEAQLLVDSGWAQPVTAERTTVRRRAPQVQTVGDEFEQQRDEAARSARLPSLAWRVARTALQHGPVLVQVARAGYVPALACARCRAAAGCPACGGGLRLDGSGGVPRCEKCGQTASGWRCAQCGHDRPRAAAVGVRRTAEELGRAFPGVPVILSRGERRLSSVSSGPSADEPGTAPPGGANSAPAAPAGVPGPARPAGAPGADEGPVGAGVRDAVGAEPALVIATHGAEPVAAGGYAAALLLDGDSMLTRPGLRSGEEALRRWVNAAALVRGRDGSGTGGGEVVVVADPSARPVQALVRWDPAGFAVRELAERGELHFPPAARVAELRGERGDVAELMSIAELPEPVEVLGPDPVLPLRGHDPGVEETVQVLIRVPRTAGAALAAAVRAAAGVRSARRSGGPVRVRIDPVDLG